MLLRRLSLVREVSLPKEEGSRRRQLHAKERTDKLLSSPNDSGRRSISIVTSNVHKERRRGERNRVKKYRYCCPQR